MKKLLKDFRLAIMIASATILSISTFGQSNVSFTGKATTSIKKNSLYLKSKTGSFFKEDVTATTLTISGSDEKGRKFTLVLQGASDSVIGTALVGNRKLMATGAIDYVIAALSQEASAIPNAKSTLPNSESINELSSEISKKQQFLKNIVGTPTNNGGVGGTSIAKAVDPVRTPVKKRDSYCVAVCKACAGGGIFSPWYCISCASCDYFGL